MSKLQRRPEPLARKLSLLKLHLAIRRTRQIFARLKFAVSGTKTLGTLAKLGFGALCCSARGTSPLRRSILSLELLQRASCHFSRPRETPQPSCPAFAIFFWHSEAPQLVSTHSPYRHITAQRAQ